MQGIYKIWRCLCQNLIEYMRKCELHIAKNKDFMYNIVVGKMPMIVFC